MRGKAAIAAIAAAGVIALAFTADRPALAAKAFKFSSPDLKVGIGFTQEHVYNGFGCKGKNNSPELEWSGVPDGTKSLAVTVYDPDAPTGSGFWHWVVFNIPPTAHRLPRDAGDLSKAGKMPAGAVQSRTDFGKPGWGGPCPPQGDKAHSYVFTLYALDVDKFDLGPETTAAIVGFNMHFHTIAKVHFQVPFAR